MSPTDPQVHLQRHGERTQQALDSPFHQWRLPDGTPWATFHRAAASYVLRFPGLADFEVANDGAQVHCWPAPGTDEATTEHLYLNQVLPLALSRQGELVLHASAVETGAGCVAFLGPTGRGKSTLAASFAAQGHRFLTDDGLRLRWEGDRLQALPSHPSIRLWQDSHAALLAEGGVVAPAVAYTRKARVLAGPALPFCTASRPLVACYFLAEATEGEVSITPERPASAFLELVRNSFLLDISEQQALSTHFDQMSRIANLPLHHRLQFPRHYESLPQVRDAVLRHALQGGTRP